ncbi:hypothetical protein [Pseudomonas protegens]|uniref:hypothetical protein n=1 Tax=Pseudomonas protegens TaxID=380021 RepID=UPI00383A8875
MSQPTLNIVTTLEVSALVNRPHYFVTRDMAVILEELTCSGLVGMEVGDAGLKRWFKKTANIRSYWVAGEYQYLNSHNSKRVALYMAKDFFGLVVGHIGRNATRKRDISLI